MSLQVAVGGRTVLIDEADADLIAAHRWSLMPGRRTPYAVTRIGGRTVYMHRLLLGHPRLSVDHINGDGLDNRRANLREATASEQQRNSRAKGSRYSPYRGVTWRKAAPCWAAQIQLPNKKRVTKYCQSAIEAAKAYNAMASEYFGEFARLNMIEEAS